MVERVVVVWWLGGGLLVRRSGRGAAGRGSAGAHPALPAQPLFPPRVEPGGEFGLLHHGLELAVLLHAFTSSKMVAKKWEFEYLESNGTRTGGTGGDGSDDGGGSAPAVIGSIGGGRIARGAADHSKAAGA